MARSGWFGEKRRHMEAAKKGAQYRKHGKVEYRARIWAAFNADGFGDVTVTGRTKEEALRKARSIYGRGATVEYRGTQMVTKVRL